MALPGKDDELDNEDGDEDDWWHQGVGLPDEERVEKETDMAKISNARDIFKQRLVLKALSS